MDCAQSLLKLRGKDPQFYDNEAGVALLTGETAVQFLNNWLKEHGREVKYQFGIQIWPSGNKQDIEPGMYCETNFLARDWDQSLMIRSAYGTLITEALVDGGYLREGQVVRIEVSNYETGEGYAILRIKIEGAKD